MDGRAAWGDEKVLRRVVAVLVALAVLAEQAAVRSWPVRCLVLWLLRRAEMAARGFVLDATGAPAAMEPFSAAVNGPDDAFRLAARFRMLAAALAALLPDACGLGHRHARPGLARGHAAPRPDRHPRGWRPWPIDTS